MNDQGRYYYKRTFAHIQRVQANALYLIENHSDFLELSDDECRELAWNAIKHDSSKFSVEQFGAYVVFSWAMKYKIYLSDKEQSDFDKAWKHHYATENHHPERLKGQALKMSKVEIVEVVCDLQAMAQEFGEGGCRGYFESKWIKHNGVCFYDDFDWECVKILMDKVISCFEKKPEAQ